MSLIILPLSNDSPNFYRTMGPFFGSRKVAKEVGIHLYDDPDKQWFTATLNGHFSGFASLRGNVISDCYVKPDCRNLGVMTELLARILLEPRVKFTANCTAASVGLFKKAGFAETGKTKNFTRVEK